MRKIAAKSFLSRAIFQPPLQFCTHGDLPLKKMTARLRSPSSWEQQREVIEAIVLYHSVLRLARTQMFLGQALYEWPTIHSGPQTHFPEGRLDRARHERRATLRPSGSIPTVHTRLANVGKRSPWRTNRARPSQGERRLACSYARVK
jgi:hypothetical protein